MTIRAVFLGAAVGCAILGGAQLSVPTAWGPTAPSRIELTVNSCVFKNCTDAHSHGRYNIPSNDQAYCPKQDRDNDGIACEG